MKRKRFDLDKLERDSLCKRALPTKSSVNNQSSIPLDGFQYLAMVQKEAKSIPNVLVAELNVKEENERMHDARNIPLDFDPTCKISKDWFDKFIQKFQKLKRNFNNYRKQDLILKNQLNHNEASWNKLLYKDQSIKPTLDILVQINHTLALKLVKYHSNWIQDFSIIKCRWLFCLFLIIDPLLTSDQVDNIRNLARNLLKLNLDSLNNSEKASIQIILSIISGIFGQRDVIILEKTF